MFIKINKMVLLYPLIFFIVLLAPMAAFGDDGNSACHIYLTLDPAAPQIINENESLSLIVTAHYTGKAKDIMMSAHYLPDFAGGWQNKEAHCGDCELVDTILFTPDYCDAGEYRIKFRAFVGNDNRTADSIFFDLTVNDVDHPCSLAAVDEIFIFAGQELTFDIAAIDADTICGDDVPLTWEMGGYPGDHGAILIPDGWHSTFVWTPEEQDLGTHEVYIYFSDGFSECTKTVIVKVTEYDCRFPVIISEPEYTQGTSNTVCFIPACGAYTHDICYFDYDNPGQLYGCVDSDWGQALAVEDTVCLTIENLKDGHRYVYFVKAYFIEGPDSVTLSDTTSSTQDASPPDSVLEITAEADSGGVVIVNWRGVLDRVSYVDYYELYRKSAMTDFVEIHSVPAVNIDDTASEYEFIDYLGGPTGLEEGIAYHYTVRAVDIVGNRGGGFVTGAVVPDSTAPCVPDQYVEYDYRFFTPYLIQYKQGVENRAWGRSNCLGLQTAHFIRFQAVRDSAKFFDAQWQPGTYFFAGDWLEYGGDSLSFDFNFLPFNSDTAFVHSHQYLYRCQARDSLGNTSAWSTLDSAYQDAYPPEDISNLEVTPYYDETLNDFLMIIRWKPAVDHVSGLKEYHVYRQIDDSGFKRIVTLDRYTTTYHDTLVGLTILDRTCYRIGSSDQVGNRRSFEHTNWEACVRTYQGPRFTLDCYGTNGDTCYTSQSEIGADWSEYDNTGVKEYNIEINGTNILIRDVSQSSYMIPLTDDGMYVIRMNAVFLNGLVSTWSEPQYVIRDTDLPDPVDYLEANNDPECDSGFIFLEWSQPYDESGIGYYHIVRDNPASCEPYAISYDTFWVDTNVDTAYKYHTYHVCPVDNAGNIQPDGNNSDSEYFNPAPVIDTFDTAGCEVTIFVDRSMPNLSNDYFYICELYKDTIAPSNLEKICSTYNVDTIQLGCLDTGYYYVRVKEVPQDLYDEYSAWSVPLFMPLKTPPPVEAVILQPQPMLRADADSAAGKILIDWIYDPPFDVHYLKIIRSRGDIIEMRCTVSVNKDYFVDTVGLYAYTEYEYCIVPFSIYGPISVDTMCAADTIDPLAMYTPYIKDFGFTHFKGDSIEVCWEWLNSDSESVGNEYGADTIIVEASNNRRFEDFPGSLIADTVVNGECIYMQIHELDLRTDQKIYFRVMALDAWSNESPWSTEYQRPPVSITLDTIPPLPISGLEIKSVADSSSEESTIDVILTWNGTHDNTSGSRLAYYRIYCDLQFNESSWKYIDSINAESSTYTHENLKTDTLPDSCRYRIVPGDNMGNENNVLGGQIATFYILVSPHLLDTMVQPGYIVWQYGGAAVDSFYAECALESGLLGTKYMNLYSDSVKAWFEPGDTSGSFGNDPIFDSIYYCHIKAIYNGNESGWSNVVRYNDSLGNAGRKPTRTGLTHNYPNPFNPRTRITFDISKQTRARIKVININGQLVKMLYDKIASPGRYEIIWDGTNSDGYEVASGIYFYQLITDDYNDTRKMILLR